MDYLYSIPNMSGGIDSAVVNLGSSDGVTVFVPFFLLFFYCFIAFTGMIQQKARTGSADVPMWLTIGGIATTMITLVMTMIQGLINPITLGAVISITILSGFWLFMDKGRNEV